MTDRDRILAAARLWIGTPYQHQAALRGVGCDCLGLIRGLWRPKRPAAIWPKSRSPKPSPATRSSSACAMAAL